VTRITKALFATLAVALLVGLLAGAALAGDGKGNSGNAPGQQKKDPAATAMTATPQDTTQAHGKSTAQSSGANTAGQAPAKRPDKAAKQSAKQSSAPKSNNSAADGTKQYGNGKTALQVARQAVPSLNASDLSGPGNSGLHKVTICHNGHLITVDVHALNAHARHLDGSDVIPATSASQCSAQQQAAGHSSSTKVETSCAGTTVTKTSTSFATSLKAKKNGKAGQHGKHKGLIKQQTSSSTQTSFTPSGANCGPASSPLASELGVLAPSSGVAGVAAGAAAGGVLGAQATLKQPAAKGGILGATATIRQVAVKGHLPFTGFPLWIAVLIALTLIAMGLALTRRGRVSRVEI
jgi:hypothetical protein